MAARIAAEDSIETSYSWVVAGTSLLILALSMGANYLAVVGVPFFEADMGWSRSGATSIYTVTTLGAGVGGMVMGFMAARVGVRTALWVAAGSIAFGCVLVY